MYQFPNFSHLTKYSTTPAYHHEQNLPGLDIGIVDMGNTVGHQSSDHLL
jgi:hypothetical protein